jgi:hypothetical protein
LRSDDYLRSAKAQFGHYRYQQRESFHVWWDGEPRSKSAPLQDQLDFQRQVLAALTAAERTAFRGRVLLRLTFSTTERDAPHLQSLARNYLDLLQRPLPELGPAQPRLALRDDRQVEVLTVRQFPNAPQPYVSVDVIPMGYSTHSPRAAPPTSSDTRRRPASGAVREDPCRWANN